MLSLSKNDYGLNSNALKSIAAFTMLIDHIGVILFPHVTILRIIGRISFPIYAFMIAEGCEHTKNKLKYFLLIFILGAGCQTVLHIAKGPQKLGVLISFSISILTIYALQYMKSRVFSAETTIINKCFAVCVFLFALISVYFLNKHLRIDYGFWGCMTPLSASLLKQPTFNKSTLLKKLDNKFLHLLLLSICLVILGFRYRGTQMYALFSIIFLLFYSGKRGTLKMKYFFYIFYPVHLVILEGISYLLP